MAVRYWEGFRKLLAEMKWLLGIGSGRFSSRDKVFGHVFCGGQRLLERGWLGEGHLNPPRARLLKPHRQCGKLRGATDRSIWRHRGAARVGAPGPRVLRSGHSREQRSGARPESLVARPNG